MRRERGSICDGAYPIESSIITVCRRKAEYGDKVEQRKYLGDGCIQENPTKVRFQERTEPFEL